MSVTLSTLTSRIVRACAVVAVVLGTAAVTWLTANAVPSVVPPLGTDEPVLSASLESSQAAVPLTGEFAYTTRIRLQKPASYLQTRIQVRRPTGQLIFQRTVVDNNLPAGPHTAEFGRSLAGLDLEPGAYPVEVEIRGDLVGGLETTTIATDLLVFDPAKQSAGTVLVARVTAQPLEAPDGTLAIDPAVATKARDDVTSIASLVIADPTARITLAIPPMLLSEWQRVSDGYTLADGREVPATDPTAVAYAAALEALGQAVATDRLELLWTGLADPDIAQLASQGQSRDIVPQYEAGLSATYASLETSPSTGTVPAGPCIPPAAMPALKGLGLGYVITDVGCARSGDSTVGSGSYTISNSSMRALLTDTIASTALSSADTTAAIKRIALRQVIKPAHPTVVRIELPEDGSSATQTIAPAIRALEGQQWTRLVLGRDGVKLGKVQPIRLLADKTSPAGPQNYLATVSRARLFAEALTSSLGEADADASSARMTSLVSQSSAWADPDGSWDGANRGEAFAKASIKTSRSILDKVGLKIEPITLAGAKGSVPVSLQNGSEKVLQVTVRTATQGGIEVVGPKRTLTMMRPQETFVQIPINMHSAISGKLSVEILAGDVVLARRTVEVRASYLDRLAVIGGIVIALAILLAFIVRRVRAAERAEEAELARTHTSDTNGRYTDASEPEAEEPEVE